MIKALILEFHIHLQDCEVCRENALFFCPAGKNIFKKIFKSEKRRHFEKVTGKLNHLKRQLDQPLVI